VTDQGLHDTVLAIALIVMGLGLIGIVVPMIPGTILIFATAVAYAFIDGFQGVGWPTIAVLGLLTLVSTSAELWATGMGAKAGGASGWSVAAGLIGGIVGLIILTLPGAIIGAMLGVIVSEILRVGDWRKALKAGGGWLVGWLLSSVLQLAIGLIMVALFYWQARWPQ
jgi:hypothetical protein